MSEVREVRTQEIKLIKYDDPFGNTRYTGRSSSMRGLDSEPVWQIMREHKNCVTGVTTETHANMVSTTACGMIGCLTSQSP